MESEVQIINTHKGHRPQEAWELSEFPSQGQETVATCPRPHSLEEEGWGAKLPGVLNVLGAQKSDRQTKGTLTAKSMEWLLIKAMVFH